MRQLLLYLGAILPHRRERIHPFLRKSLCHSECMNAFPTAIEWVRQERTVGTPVPTFAGHLPFVFVGAGVLDSPKVLI